MITNVWSLHDYHFVWYILGFLIAPRLTLAIIVSVYTPIALWLKIIMWLLVFAGGTSKKDNVITVKAN